MGYRRPPQARIDLLRPLHGRPYVDVRRSANSLLPAALSKEAGARLVDHWIDRLTDRPALHDKVEFSLFCSARDLRSSQQWAAEFEPLLGPQDSMAFQQSLTGLTVALMGRHPLDRAPTLMAIATGKIASLTLPSLRSLTRRAAFEFAVLARIAFVAEAQLRSAIARGAIDPARAPALRGTSGLITMLTGTKATQPTLRPSSFDLTQPLWRSDKRAERTDNDSAQPLSSGERRTLQSLLTEVKLPPDPQAWANWLALATQAREWGKIMFSQPLTAWLEQIADRSEHIGLDRETLSWLGLRECDAALSGRLTADTAREYAAQARAHSVSQHRQLMSPVLTSRRDLCRFDSLDTQPNFVGSLPVRATLQRLQHGDPQQSIVPGAIVALEHADPGFDWLFARNIGGLITAWGGAHSHIGIRCAEHGVVAVLGCGEAVWAQVERASEAHVDPLAGALWLN